MNDDTLQFENNCKQEIEKMKHTPSLKDKSFSYLNEITRHNYCYHFKWLGMPIIQYPQDIIAMQELIFDIKPDFIVETGIARGGSLVFYSSMLELLGGDNKKVIGVDIDIRPHNRTRIESHPLYKNICLIEGDATHEGVIQQIDEIIAANGLKKGLVVLDSMHTHDHVLKELRLYNKYVKSGSYLVVFDTIVEYLDEDNINNRPWRKGDNPLTAVTAFLQENDRFVIDEEIESKLLVTVCPSGYLKCIK